MTVSLVDPDLLPAPAGLGPNRPVASIEGVSLKVTGDVQAEVEAVVSPTEPELGPILLRSISLATIIMFVGVGAPMWLLTGQVWDGIGLGAFCAFWGGPGFGLMAGGASWTAKMERSAIQDNGKSPS